LLPVPYFHLLFTLPHTLYGWVQLHPDVIYRCLFAAVWNTLNQDGRNTRHLGGELGMTAVLHTWGQNLSRHVHVHCLILGGVLTGTGDWHKTKNNYLFRVRALSRRFRGRMVSLLRAAVNAGLLRMKRLRVPLSYPTPDGFDGVCQTACRGRSFAVESVAAFVWNGRQASSGISGNLGLEYAFLRANAGKRGIRGVI
jgi:hypothetical protein